MQNCILFTLDVDRKVVVSSRVLLAHLAATIVPELKTIDVSFVISSFHSVGIWVNMVSGGVGITTCPEIKALSLGNVCDISIRVGRASRFRALNVLFAEVPLDH